jgi:hypothetical protein
MDWAQPGIALAIDDWISRFSSTVVAAIVKGGRDYLDSWDEYRTGGDQYLELDVEPVLELSHHSGSGKTSSRARATVRMARCACLDRNRSARTTVVGLICIARRRGQ